MRRGIQIPDGARAVFRVGTEEITVTSLEGELRVYADNVIHIIPWATNTIRIRVEPLQEVAHG